MHKNTHRANKCARQTKYRHLASNSQIPFTNTETCGLLRPGFWMETTVLKYYFCWALNHGRNLVSVQTKSSFLYRNRHFTRYGCVCVFELKCVKHFLKVIHSHQCPFSVKTTRKTHQSVECFWARTPIGSTPKCGWKNSGMEMTQLGSFCLALNEKQINTQYTGQSQRNPFYKSKSENM